MERRDFLLASVVSGVTGALAKVQSKIERIPLIQSVERVSDQTPVTMDMVRWQMDDGEWLFIQNVQVNVSGILNDGKDTSAWRHYALCLKVPFPVRRGDAIVASVTRNPV